MTLGDKLTQTKKEANDFTFKEQADLLRFFVKSTLLEALQRAVTEGNDYAPVEAPRAIRYLFEEWEGKAADMYWPHSPFRAVWDELFAWADSEGLYFATAGHCGEWLPVPSSQQRWQAFMGIKAPPAPEPERPIPPEPLKLYQTIHQSVFDSRYFWLGLGFMFVVAIFFMAIDR